MELRIKRVEAYEKEILRNLLEKYDYEFSQWDGRDVNAMGLFGYAYLDHYWTEENRFAYFLFAEGKIAGFAMVNGHNETLRKADLNLAEFCILPKYRCGGLGKWFAMHLFDMHRGTWRLKRHPNNIASVRFWDKVIAEYTKGKYEIVFGCREAIYDDGSAADIMYFESC